MKNKPANTQGEARLAAASRCGMLVGRQRLCPAMMQRMLAVCVLWPIVLLLTGCGSLPHQNTARSPARPERYYVMEAALRFEMGKHSAAAGERDLYSCYILNCDEFTRELLEDLRENEPPVLLDVVLTTDETTQELLDKSNGKHIKAWRVEIAQLGRSTATAYVFWNSLKFRLGCGSYTMTLRRKAGKWEVASEKSGVTS